jgi:two-component system cell cycle response regulator DivK
MLRPAYHSTAPLPVQAIEGILAMTSALIIEDNSDLGAMFDDILRSQVGISTEVISEGRRALERIAEIVPDVVLLDIHLPHVSGLEILDRIRADPRLANTRVIVLSGDAFRAEEARHKADLVLTKPIEFREIKQLIARLVEYAETRVWRTGD